MGGKEKQNRISSITKKPGLIFEPRLPNFENQYNFWRCLNGIKTFFLISLLVSDFQKISVSVHSIPEARPCFNLKGPVHSRLLNWPKSLHHLGLKTGSLNIKCGCPTVKLYKVLPWRHDFQQSPQIMPGKIDEKRRKSPRLKVLFVKKKDHLQ